MNFNFHSPHDFFFSYIDVSALSPFRNVQVKNEFKLISYKHLKETNGEEPRAPPIS